MSDTTKPDALLDAINRRDLRDVRKLANHPDSIAVNHKVAAEENLAKFGAFAQLTQEKYIVDHLNTLVKPEVHAEANAQLKANKEKAAQEEAERDRLRQEIIPSKVEQLAEKRKTPKIILTGRGSYR